MVSKLPDLPDPGAVSDRRRVFEIRPYTYLFRGAGALGFALYDDRGTWIGVYDVCADAEAHAARLGAATRRTWES